jgi:hypothetical protein
VTHREADRAKVAEGSERRQAAHVATLLEDADEAGDGARLAELDQPLRQSREDARLRLPPYRRERPVARGGVVERLQQRLRRLRSSDEPERLGREAARLVDRLRRPVEHREKGRHGLGPSSRLRNFSTASPALLMGDSLRDLVSRVGVISSHERLLANSIADLPNRI